MSTASKAVPAITIAAAVAATALAAVTMTGCSQASGDPIIATGEHSVTATASAEVRVAPDKAQVTVGIVSRESTAQAAQDANAAASDAVVAALQNAGIAEKSIRTDSVNLYPSYDYQGNEITGYEMSTMLAVSDLGIDDVGQVIQAAVGAGATRVDGIRYYASTYDEAYDQALHEAIDAAHAKAESMASAAGSRVGGIISLVEGYQNTYSRYSTASYDAAEAVGAAMFKAMPGELAITASVTATYVLG